MKNDFIFRRQIIIQKMLRFLYLVAFVNVYANAYNCKYDSSLSPMSLKPLEKKYSIQKGDFVFTNKSYGNPAGTYGVFKFDNFPPALNFVIQNISSFFSLNTTSTVIGRKDALVLQMCTPPFGDYFSFVNYVLVRFNLPKYWLAATPLNDPINQLVMNTSTSNPYNASVLFISTGDYETFLEIRESFLQNGIDPHTINYLPIPVDKFKFRHYHLPWILDQADLINYHFRLSSYDHYNPLMIEYLNITWPFYFLHSKNVLRGQPARSFPERPRQSNQTQVYKKDNLYELVTKTIQSLAKTHIVKNVFNMDHIIPDFTECLTNSSYLPIFPNLPQWGVKSIPGFCDFFVRDSLYSVYPNIYASESITNDLKFGTNRTIAVFGINQVVAKQAMYTNLLLTPVSHPEDPAHTSNVSANSLVGSTDQEPYFRWYWSRNCTQFGKFCREISYKEINNTDWVFMAERKYLNPTTKIGPDPTEVLEPLVVIFEEI